MEVTGNLDKINRGQWSRNRTLSREQRIEDAEEKGTKLLEQNSWIGKSGQGLVHFASFNPCNNPKQQVLFLLLFYVSGKA